MSELRIGERIVSASHPPLVIAEIGINHEGLFDRAVGMVDAAKEAGAECVKFQCHVIEDEMIPNDVVPSNARESIWDIMDRCKLSEDEDRRLMDYVRERGLIYLSTPFSRAAADRLESMGVEAFKIGSGECNNLPLIRHIAAFGKPVILSTGMNDLHSVAESVAVLRAAPVPFSLLHCTSMYPTPYDRVRLGAMEELGRAFPDAVLGLSDHSLGNYTCFAAVSLGACILEKHFTYDKSLPGPDVAISLDPAELHDLIQGSRAIHQALGGSKEVLAEEQPTIDFAYSCVVTLRPIEAGEELTMDNVWVKRPGTGEIKARDFDLVLGRRLKLGLVGNQQLRWEDLQ